jgi:protocatechuate 3,4-dioxygenase beta subunit
LNVTFSDGGKGGSFNPSTVATDQTGSASTLYTLPTKSNSYSLTASAPGYLAGLFTETAVPGPASALVAWNGNNQSAPVATPLRAPLVAKVEDSFGNGLPGVAVTYSDTGAGGTFSTNPVTSDSRGLASVNYTTSTTAGALHGKITATAAGLHSVLFFETVTPGPASNIATVSGNGQSAPPNTQLAQPLVVKVTDQYGNAVSGISVTFNDAGAGGTFSANPISTSSNAEASVNVCVYRPRSDHGCGGNAKPQP